MTDRSDRAGEDGLAERFTRWVEQYAIKICPPGCLPLPAQEKEIRLFAEIVRALASPPSGNAGEGAEEAIKSAFYEGFEIGCNEGAGLANANHTGRIYEASSSDDFWLHSQARADAAETAAPPQPAPDAVRDAVKAIEAKIAQLEHFRDNECQLEHARTIADGRILQARQDVIFIDRAMKQHHAESTNGAKP